MAERSQQIMSDYRIKKFKSYFTLLDTNKDGFISKEDYEQVAENMAMLSGASPEEAEDMLAIAMFWWKNLSASKGMDAKIPISEALQNAIRYNSSTSPTIVSEKSRITHEKIFDLIDRNKDGFISPEELRMYYKSHEVHDEDFIRDIFHRIDVDGDGLISREELVTALSAFWLSDDPENGYGFIYDFPQ
ncbi:sarcoplasmic calcium-binding protein-like [Liolophura sinensis]|uniref:sarcoplasmic calcium-binding protein-like n=1 Tax=Liolophura sinensis TaxID=3198878 RepID=UPI003158368F